MPIRTLSLTACGVSYFPFLLFCFTVICLCNCRPTRPHTPLRMHPHTPICTQRIQALIYRFFFLLSLYLSASARIYNAATFSVCIICNTPACMHHPHLSKCFLFLCFFFWLICVHMHIQVHLVFKSPVQKKTRKTSNRTGPQPIWTGPRLRSKPSGEWSGCRSMVFEWDKRPVATGFTMGGPFWRNYATLHFCAEKGLFLCIFFI